MAIFTLPEIDEQLAARKAALIACFRNQSYDYNGRKITRADLPEIRSTLEFLKRERASVAGSCVPYIVVGRPSR